MVSTKESDQLIPLLEKYVSQGAESEGGIEGEAGILREDSQEEDPEMIQEIED